MLKICEVVNRLNDEISSNFIKFGRFERSLNFSIPVTFLCYIHQLLLSSCFFMLHALIKV